MMKGFHLPVNNGSGFDLCVDYKNGDFPLRPFKSLYLETKLINERLKKCDLIGNSTIDMLQLSRYYQFKPLKNKLKELMSRNTQFRDFVHVKDRGLIADGWLSYIWMRMGMSEEFFSWFSETSTNTIGKPGFFGDSAVLGNFDIFIMNL